MTKARDLANASTALSAVSATELGYLDGVTSAVQTQIDSKQAANANVSTTELGYLDGVTSAIQTQIDAKASTSSVSAKRDKILTRSTSTGTSYTLVLGDAYTMVTLTNGSAITLTVPLNSSVAYDIGTEIHLLQGGAGQVTVAGASGVTVVATFGLKLRTQWSAATLVKLTADSWVLIGDTAA